VRALQLKLQMAIIPRPLSSIVEDRYGENKGMLIYYAGSKLVDNVRNELPGNIELEMQSVEISKHVPWVFRVNEVIAKWFGMQMGIFFLHFKLTKIVCDHLHQHMMRTALQVLKTNAKSSVVYSKQFVKSSYG
jgi:hypothetical protein